MAVTQGKKTETTSLIVTQSNQLVEAMYSPALTARAHKVARLVISLISPEDVNFRLYTMKVDSLKKYLGYTEGITWGRFVDDMRDIFDRLRKEKIEIKSGDKVTLTSFLAGVEINMKDSTVTIEISQLLKPYLLEIKKNFTSYLLAYIPKLRSIYSIRLYELLCQYRKIGWRAFKLDELQKLVGSDYIYGDFKRKVVSIAERDLREFTDIRFEYEEIKHGKKVERIKFFIYPNKPTEKQSPQLLLDIFNTEVEIKPVAISEHVRKSILQIGISEEKLTELIAKGFDLVIDAEKRQDAIERCPSIEAYFLEKLTLLEQSKKVLDSGNPAGFFLEAVKENWISNKTIKEIKSREGKKKFIEAKQQLKTLEESLKNLWNEYKGRYNPILNGLTEQEDVFMAAYQQAKTQYNGAAFLLKPNLSPKQQFEESPFFKNFISNLLEKQFPDLFANVNATYLPKIDELKKQVKELRLMFGING